MVGILHYIKKSKYIVAAGLTVLATAVGGIVAPAPASAAAVHCRVFTAESGFYEAGRFATKEYTVPGKSVSGCVDINVRNIQNQDPRYPNDHCAFFTVALFVNGTGDPDYSPRKFACSTGPDGSVRPIALGVPNGTKYRVIYEVETTNPANGHPYHHSFQIVD